MNKKGNIFFGFAVFLFLFVMGILFLPYVTDDIVTAREALSCSDADNISSGIKLTCLNIGFLVPYFIYFVASAALAYLFTRN